MVKTSHSNLEGVGSMPIGVAKIPHASWPKRQNLEQKQYCNKFNKDFKKMVYIKKKKKVQKQTHGTEESFENQISDNGLIFRIHKDFL